jgi:hypothetical protein
MPVKPNEGTAGGARDLLADIAEMRGACIPANALVASLRMIDADERPMAA